MEHTVLIETHAVWPMSVGVWRSVAVDRGV